VRSDAEQPEPAHGALRSEGALRPTWAEVDLGALASNVRALRARAGRARLMAVVKADAYGHGAVPVARAALAAGAERLGTAIVEEALELRRAGIDAPVLVLGWTPPERTAEALAAGIELTVTRLEDGAAMAAAARRAGAQLSVHAKVDTGMSRLGFAAAGAADAVAALAALPGLRLAGVYTHFATADEADLGGARHQLQSFLEVLGRLEASGVAVPLRHAANTAAILRLPESHLDMVRAGIGLYGYVPSPEVPRAGLSPVLSWRSRVALVKRLPPGSGVSYNHTYVTPAAETVATLPVGYADGFPRSLSGRGEVLVRGRRAPVRGRVCMDQIVVSVDAIPGVQVGDEVVLIGAQGCDVLTADDLAAAAGTISYEILCGIGRRVPRLHRQSEPSR
jgi:alanine racemase